MTGDAWESVGILTLLDDVTTQRNKLLSVTGSQRKEIETLKTQLVDAYEKIDQLRRVMPKESMAVYGGLDF